MRVDEIDLAALELWTEPEEVREEAFRTLRRERPVAFFEERMPPNAEELGLTEFPLGPGYYALTKYDDVVFASRHPDLFCSGQGTNIFDMPTELNDMLGSMINMDAPRHTKLRLLVNKGFTPRMVARIEDYVHEIARECVEGIAEADGPVDFVTDVAAPMPLRIICDMMGIPREDNEFIFQQTNHLLGGFDPDYNSSIADMLGGGWNMWNYAQELGEKRLADPQDDITTALMHAEVDGERLSASEFGSFFVLLCTAGNETTRNAIAHGLLELTRHPDQRRQLVEDPAGWPAAVEEIVRWATPVIHFRRTVTEEVALPSGRHTFQPGDKVVLWYNSANRDEDAWDRPYEFDVTRTPNEHVGFGAGGPHFCLGANLARREIRVLFEELFRVLPDIEATGEPSMLQSNFIHGIKHLTAEVGRRA